MTTDSGPDATGDAGADAATDGGADSSSDGASDATNDAAPDAARLVKVTNRVTGCDAVPEVVAPGVGEYGHWQAARLVPSSYPFTVTKVEYALGHESAIGCKAELAHKIRVFKSSGATPAATPTVLEEHQMAAGLAAPRVVTYDLTTPIALAQGESLFVTIEMVGTSETSKLCVQTCKGVAGTADKNWWSNATAAPFPWATLASFNILDDALIAMWGH